jgi:hypothetical protein
LSKRKTKSKAQRVTALAGFFRFELAHRSGGTPKVIERVHAQSHRSGGTPRGFAMGVVKYGQGIFGVGTLALHLAYRLRAKRKSLSALSKTKEPIGFE